MRLALMIHATRMILVRALNIVWIALMIPARALMFPLRPLNTTRHADDPGPCAEVPASTAEHHDSRTTKNHCFDLLLRKYRKRLIPTIAPELSIRTSFTSPLLPGMNT